MAIITLLTVLEDSPADVCKVLTRFNNNKHGTAITPHVSDENSRKSRLSSRHNGRIWAEQILAQPDLCEAKCLTNGHRELMRSDAAPDPDPDPSDPKPTTPGVNN